MIRSEDGNIAERFIDVGQQRIVVNKRIGELCEAIGVGEKAGDQWTATEEEKQKAIKYGEQQALRRADELWCRMSGALWTGDFDDKRYVVWPTDEAGIVHVQQEGAEDWEDVSAEQSLLLLAALGVAALARDKKEALANSTMTMHGVDLDKLNRENVAKKAKDKKVPIIDGLT